MSMLPLDEVSHVEVLPIGTEREAFGETADISLRHPAHRLSLDLEERHVGFFMPVEGFFGCAASAVEDQRCGIAASRAHGEPFWTIADDNLIDDAGRGCFEVNDTNGVDSAILAAADVVDDRQLAVGRDLYVKRVKASSHVVILTVDLRIADFLAVDVE
jgi:hypothetical protein